MRPPSPPHVYGQRQVPRVLDEAQEAVTQRLLAEQAEREQQAAHPPTPEPQPVAQPVAQPVPQPQPQPQPQLQAVPNNVTPFPPRGAFLPLPPMTRWILWTAATLTMAAILAYIISQLDYEEDPQPRRRSGGRGSRQRRPAFLDDLEGDEDDDDDDDDDRPAARSRNRGSAGRRSASSRSQQPVINVHVPPSVGGHQAPASSGGGNASGGN